MSTHPVLVTGATGTVGRHVVDGLLAAGQPVRALTRRPGAADLPAEVDVREGDLDKPATVLDALAGVQLLYLFPAPELTGTLAAASAAGVEHVVLLSSLSVEYAEPDGSSRAHLACEAAVLAAGMSHTFLRPGAFMGNDLIWVPEIQSFGTVSAAYPEAAHAPVDERDIASVAVAALCHPGRFAGVVPLTGPESLTQRRRVELIAGVTGQQIGFVELTPEQARTRLGAYLPAAVVELLLGVLAGAPAEVSTAAAGPDVIGRSAYRYVDWVDQHRARFARAAPR
ncbi:MAG: hypothetical protein QOD96_5283 [Pseudonocardiales bacterium]|nr:hypothetical protein [Pseudonocardiales bacterium]